MRIIRILGSIALWLGAVLGVAAGAVWIGGQFGLVQPLIVISGSMEPGIKTGDLILATPTATDQVEVGDVLTLPSELTGNLVTHRAVAIERVDGQWEINMKGDANAEGDLETYLVGDEVLTPTIKIPAGGKVVSKVMEPTVAMPVLLALIALLGLSLLDEEPRKVVRRAIQRVRQRDPRVDELDAELAAAGVDVTRLQDMDDLDLQLYALGIDVDHDVDHAENESELEREQDAADDTIPMSRNGRGFEDGLWGLTLPDSDGIELVRTPSTRATEPASSPSQAEPSGSPESAEPGKRAQRTPARSG
jgi:signal peptidase